VTGRESLTARGKHHLLDSETPASPVLADILSNCLLCGACENACSRGIDTPSRVVEARGRMPGGTSFLAHLTRKALGHPALLTAGRKAGRLLTRCLPEESGLGLRLGLLCPGRSAPHASEPEIQAKTRMAVDPATSACLLFTGCLAAHLEPEIATATAQVVARLTGSPPFVPEVQTCCGMAARSAGDLQAARRLARKNIVAFEGSDLPILTPCGSCSSHLLTYPALLADDPAWSARALAFAGRLRELTSFCDTLWAQAAPGLKSPPPAPERVFYHDPCHLRFDLKITNPPRRLLQRLPGVETAELPGGPRCCGLGGLFHLSHPEISRRIRDDLAESFAELGATVVVTTCTGCLLQWRQISAAASSPARVMHLAIFLARYLESGKKN
jgi:glycolate oxidase iron-sulfur subunit